MNAVPSVTRGERTLDRMRRYTTGSLVFVMVTFTVMSVIQAPDWPWRGALVVAGGLTTWLVAHWERGAPWWLAALAIGAAFAVWTWCVAARAFPLSSILVSMALLVVLHRSRPRRLAFLAVGLAVVLAPVAVVAMVRPTEAWLPWAATSTIIYLACLGLFLLNDYGWGLNLELDAARRDSAELAVARERFRFAADLHDIQGHTLHVIRLKMRLANRLMDSDPTAARAQLAEADRLVGETLQNTRRLAFGDRRVTLAGELANARAIADAAGIQWTQSGDAAAADDELLALTVREATTNLLRHAQATRVEVAIGAREVSVTNDGASEATTRVGGLGTLGDRLRAAGGGLDAGAVGGVYTTRAWLP